MLDLIVINKPKWCLSIESAGFGRVKVSDSSGQVVYASRAEKNVLQDILRELVKRKLPATEFEEVKENIAGDFCCAIFENAEAPGFSMVYGVVFGNHPIPELVEKYIAGNRKFGKSAQTKS